MIKKLLSKLFCSDNDRCVIDQGAYWRQSEQRLEGFREYQRALDLEERRTSAQVWSWARDTVKARFRIALPPRCRPPLAAWLPGLTAQEVIHLSRASTVAIRRHIYGVPEERIAGVRAVQPLQPCELVFPHPAVKPAEDMRDRGSAGGPKQRFA